MTVKDLYSAMSGIEDRYLAMADAPNKEDISMKKHSAPVHCKIAVSGGAFS